MKVISFSLWGNEIHFVGQAYAGSGKVLKGSNDYFQEYMREEYNKRQSI